MLQAARLFLALCLAASGAFAAPAAPLRPVSPLDNVETLNGRVNVRSDGRFFVVTVEKPAGGFRRFDVEIADQAGMALDLREDAGEVHYWRGHLVVVAPNERKAFHFSVKDMVKPVRAVDAPLASASDAAELDSMLRSKYELTRSAAVVISSLGGPRALEAGGELRSRIAPVDIDYQDPGGGGGLGTCGSSCSISCGDGSSCSTNCVAPRCSSCTCPASCSCR